MISDSHVGSWYQGSPYLNPRTRGKADNEDEIHKEIQE